MTLTLQVAWILAISLVALRFGAVLVLAPVLGTVNVPARVRVLFVLALSALLVVGLKLDPSALPTTVPGLALAALSELVIGALLAFGLFTAFAVFLLAGRVMDIQLGFGVATLIDPTNRTQSPLLGTILNLTAVALFFAIDGHLMLIRGLAYSLEQVPPGTLLTGLDPASVVAQFGDMFIYAVAVAAPVLFTILLIDVVLAVLARTMPQMNVFIVSLPLKIFVGLLVLTISVRYLAPLSARVFEHLFEYWDRLLA